MCIPSTRLFIVSFILIDICNRKLELLLKKSVTFNKPDGTNSRLGENIDHWREILYNDIVQSFICFSGIFSFLDGAIYKNKNGIGRKSKFRTCWIYEAAL